MLSMRETAFDPGEATSSRVTMTHVLPSRKGTLSAFAIFHISRLNPAPHIAPVYTSDPALPRRPQDSVPACPLRLWPDETFTHRHSSASHDVLPGRGVGQDSASPRADCGERASSRRDERPAHTLWPNRCACLRHPTESAPTVQIQPVARRARESSRVPRTIPCRAAVGASGRLG